MKPLLNLFALAVLLVTSCVSISWGYEPDDSTSVMAKPVPIKLAGAATGGELIMTIGYSPNPSAIFVIPTQQGDQPSDVFNRAAPMMTDFFLSRGFVMAEFTVQGNEMIGTVGRDYIFHGTESGLGIPKGPIGLTALRTKDETVYSLSWVPHPDATYDEVRLHYMEPNDTSSSRPPAMAKFPGSVTTCEIRSIPDGAFFVIYGMNDGIPSPCNVVVAQDNGIVDSPDFPFIDGIQPNWLKWPEDGSILWTDWVDKPRTIEKRDHSKPYMFSGQKAHCQGITTNGPGIAGLARPIIDLDPGEAHYDMSIQLELPGQLKSVPDWSIEFHAFSIKLADLQAALSHRAELMLDASQLTDETRLLAITQESDPPYDRWFTVGQDKDAEMPFGTVTKQMDREVLLFVIAASNLQGHAVKCDWFTCLPVDVNSVSQ